jgi:hypothetical protein
VRKEAILFSVWDRGREGGLRQKRLLTARTSSTSKKEGIDRYDTNSQPVQSVRSGVCPAGLIFLYNLCHCHSDYRLVCEVYRRFAGLHEEPQLSFVPPQSIIPQNIRREQHINSLLPKIIPLFIQRYFSSPPHNSSCTLPSFPSAGIPMILTTKLVQPVKCCVRCPSPVSGLYCSQAKPVSDQDLKTVSTRLVRRRLYKVRALGAIAELDCASR